MKAACQSSQGLQVCFGTLGTALLLKHFLMRALLRREYMCRCWQESSGSPVCSPGTAERL